MKRMILVSLISLLAGITFAQNYKAESLVNKVWTIKSDEMSGVGVHTSLAANTELQFASDGTWKSTQPIREVTQGTWKLEDGRTLILLAADEELKYLILQLTDNELQYRLKKNAATYTYTWVSK
jgi:hypothetical protein